VDTIESARHETSSGISVERDLPVGLPREKQDAGTSPHMSNVMLRRCMFMSGNHLSSSRPSIYTKADHRYGKIDTFKS